MGENEVKASEPPVPYVVRHIVYPSGTRVSSVLNGLPDGATEYPTAEAADAAARLLAPKPSPTELDVRLFALERKAGITPADQDAARAELAAKE